MPKGEKVGLGRALVKHHNQMIQQSKEKGRYYRSQHKKVLESVTEVSDIEAVIEQADEAHRLFSAVNSPVQLPINLDSASSKNEMMTLEERKEQQKKEEALHASSLRIPRRPPWTAEMSYEELDSNEKQAFLEWRRNLARLEENENLVLTPFEKNLDIWRQLWRVLERSDLLVMVVDARDPLFYRCPDLEAYAQEIDEHKRTLLLVNKADLLPLSVREKWANYFHQHGILFVFWSAKAASAALEGKDLSIQQDLADAETKVYGRDELLARLQSEAEDIVSMRSQSKSTDSGSSDVHSDDESVSGHAPPRGVMVGFVGYPNVGKSSTINALVGAKRTGVTSTPGKTKHFQTLIISEKLTLCDCPGLVFPSFTSSRHEMIASGVLPIDRLTERREAVQVVANRVPRSVIEGVYKITLPKPKSYEPQSRPPLAAEFLRAYCASRGYVASSGLPDETRAARQILKHYIEGKLPHFEMPPGMSNDEDGAEDAAELSSSEEHESDASDDEDSTVDEDELATGLEHVLDDLNTFDIDNGLASAKKAVKKISTKPHKQQKKPQRKKDRSWRVHGGEGDGMPVVRVFQKAASRGSAVA
ncbi:P-loop containing nucleoside triphosphate hydrolases superfamily protein [Perilla frutescens var. hirtella]|uniref:P-loop containing nucleoside triphosphate hydrolases superfamily protein n=1 Tax=Perilla frutescens var. hirtella TaxID=608512 RepID=A0AAD4JDV8_PERFH|nr:P-loop containing nucleoside triphosphate hydrolases superfamily protein [Perilla frutescens var. hirtella]